MSDKFDLAEWIWSLYGMNLAPDVLLTEGYHKGYEQGQKDLIEQVDTIVGLCSRELTGTELYHKLKAMLEAPQGGE